MNLNNLLLLNVVLFLGGCGVFKKKLAQSGGHKEAIENAVLDFSNTSKLYELDSVFSVSVHEPLYRMVLEETNHEGSKWVEGEPYDGIVAVSILASYNKLLLTDSSKIGSKGVGIPTRYIEKNGKLFYWRDDDYPLTQEVLAVLREYNLLVNNDLDGVVELYDFKINDDQKGVHYYFCKNNLTKYKKVTTNKAMGYYDPPNLNCN